MSDALNEVTIPSNPKDREKIKKVLKLISDEMYLIEGHKDVIKDEIDAVSEEFELPKKFIRKMAVAYHKDTFDKQVKEEESFASLYESIVLENESDDED